MGQTPTQGDPLDMSAGRLTACADAVIEVSQRADRPRNATEWRKALPRYSDIEISQAISFLRRLGANLNRVVTR